MFARVVLILIGIALPLPASAVDVDLSMYGSGQFDTNASRSEDGSEGDFSFRIAPTIAVRDEIPDLSYRVQYRPVYQKFIQGDEFDAFSHFAGGSLIYQIGSRTALSLTDNFTLTQVINQNLIELEADGIDVAPRTEAGRGDIYSNTASFVATHRFAPRISGQFSLTHQFFETEGDSSRNNSSLGGATSLTYEAGARDRVGLGGAMTWQQFGAIRGQPASDTYIYRIFASWLRDFGQHTQFSIRAGPALISTKQQRPDPEGPDAQFPHLDVDQEGTVAQVYDRLGFELPSPVTNLSGADGLPGSVLDPGLIIPAGSILVPDQATCPTPLMVSSEFGLSPATCPFSRIASPGTDLDQTRFIDAVKSTSINFAFPPGTNPGSTDGSTITFFGAVSLSHQWTANLSSSLEYSRSDSSVSSLGSSTVADRVTFDTTWNPNRKLNLIIRAGWVQRKSANEITNSFRNTTVQEVPPLSGDPLTGDEFEAVAYTKDLDARTAGDSIDTTYYSVSGQAAYRVSRHVTLSARLTYQRQDAKSASTSSISNFGDVIALLGVRYDLDRIHF